VFSARSRFVREPNVLARALAAVRAMGREILDLTASNPTDAGLSYDSREILEAMTEPAALRYSPSPFGLESARNAVHEELLGDGLDVSVDDIVLTASTSEAYGFAFALLCDPGDAVLVPEPSYPLLAHLGQLASVELRPYRLAYDGAWHVDLGSLRTALTPRSRALVVVSPNNPTGSFLKLEELGEIAKLGLPIVSDEVFSRYPLIDDPTRARSALLVPDVLVIALGGLSKLAALPQHKLAWMLLGGPARDVDEARSRLELVADTYLDVSAPVQHALPRLFRATRATADAIRARTRQNLQKLQQALRGSAANVLRVEGGWYAVVRFPDLASEEEWVVALLEQAGVLVQPGWFFDFAEEPYAVLSLLTLESTFAEGVARLAALVASRVA
jgi:alanine-synthesizing transaminase